MKGIYLAAYKARHQNYDIDYNDIKSFYGINKPGDMLSINLDPYDYVIATPPCNFWSKANPYYKTSKYSLETKHLLPCILEKLITIEKPFIVENVKNRKRFKEYGIYDIVNKNPNIFIYEVGRHTYFTNQFINLQCKQQFDFKSKNEKHTKRLHGRTQGGDNVYKVIEIWLSVVTRP